MVRGRCFITAAVLRRIEDALPLLPFLLKEALLKAKKSTISLSFVLLFLFLFPLHRKKPLILWKRQTNLNVQEMCC